MNRNFKFSEFTKITFDGYTLDLHNDYNLSDISIDNIGRKCSMLWKSNQFCRTKISHIIIEFGNVSRLLYDVTFSEDYYVLKFAGYLSNKDFGASDHFVDEEDSTQEDHMILSFENGSSMSILAESARATVKKFP